MTIKIKYWAFNAKTGRKPWVVTLGDKRSYFNTEAEAQKFLDFLLMQKLIQALGIKVTI